MSDDFADFADWQVHGSGGEWPKPWMNKESLSEKQKRIAKANATLLLNREAWHAKVDSFENAIQKLVGEEVKHAKRLEYHIRFDQASFESDKLDLSNYRFPCSVSFTNVHFNVEKLILDNVHFIGGDVWFRPANLNKADFFANGAIINGNFHVFADFQGAAYFRRLKVKETADFSKCTFLKVPNFLYAEFSRPPEVSGLEVPPPNFEKPGFIFQTSSNPEEVRLYRKLKAMAIAASDHEKDGEFFAYEMQAKRGVETRQSAGLLFNSFYFHLSNYGQSFMRPIIYFLAQIALFFCFYSIVVLSKVSDFKFFFFTVENSIRNALPLVGSLFRSVPKPEDHLTSFDQLYSDLIRSGVNIDLLVYLEVLQQISGVVLLFLFLLGLRNRFRLK
ncbi:MAG: hypothetical protein AAF217_03205 [Pseudomonadota bacterium]